MSISSCWTRPAPSRWATVRRAPSSPSTAQAEEELADAAQLASLTDETPEGRSIVVLAKERFGIRGRDLKGSGMQSIPFSAQTRMSGVNFDGHEIRKGAADAVCAYVESYGGTIQRRMPPRRRGDFALGRNAAARGARPCDLGRGVSERHREAGHQGNFLLRLRKMGIKTIMITGDNPMTAAAIAAEAGRGRLPGRGDAGKQA